MGRPTLTARFHAGETEMVVVSCHLKSKLLTYPGGRFHPRDEDERARYGVYALNRRAAEAATLPAHTTQLLDNHGRDRPVIVLGDLMSS